VGNLDEERYVNIPSFIFRDRSLAALESVVVYLKDSQGMNYAQIAKLLNRDDRTIWTTYQRAKKKLAADKAGQGGDK
jgi:DNA-directed RNA polymerase specialized sigma24 family protein